MAKKPAGLIYGVDDKPPLTAAALLGLQHVSVMSVGWIFVVVIIIGIGGTQEEVTNVLWMSMIASGIATILQSLPNNQRYAPGCFSFPSAAARHISPRRF